MGRKSRDSYEDELGRREVETSIADAFEAEFPAVTGRSVQILSDGECPDRIAYIEGIETGVELTAIKAGNGYDMLAELLRLATQKDESYARRRIFDIRPIILLGHLDWPARDVVGLALHDVHKELTNLVDPDDFEALRFSEIWLMDAGPKYTSRTDPRTPADFFCFSPTKKFGLWEIERKRRPYGSLVVDFMI
jgi:hypothetical protein